jgi:crossover junction endodeoxyribonuclease RusA
MNSFYTVKNNRKILSAKGRAWKEECLYRNKMWIGEKLEELPINILVKIYPPDRRIRDADNLTKAPFDICVALRCFWDDHQITSYTVRKMKNVKDGFIELIISADKNGCKEGNFYWWEYYDNI